MNVTLPSGEDQAVDDVSARNEGGPVVEHDTSTGDALLAIGTIALAIGTGLVWIPLGVITAGALIFLVGAVASRAGR